MVVDVQTLVSDMATLYVLSIAAGMLVDMLTYGICKAISFLHIK